MRNLFTILFILLFTFSAESATKLLTIKDVFIEEQETSASHESFWSIRPFKKGETYINKTGKNARFFLNEDICGSLSPDSHFRVYKKENAEKNNASIFFDKGIFIFKSRKLKNKENFVIRTPETTTGVRGTAGKLTVSDDEVDLKLPEGRVEVFHSTSEDSVMVEEGFKLMSTSNDLGKPEKMTEQEKLAVMDEILRSIRLRHPKIEKAIEKYKSKIRNYEGKLNKKELKEKIKIQGMIEKEIKKLKKKGELDEIIKLQEMLDELSMDSGVKKIDKRLGKYRKMVEKNLEKLEKFNQKESAKLFKVFTKEIKNMVRRDDMVGAKQVRLWRNEVLKGYDRGQVVYRKVSLNQIKGIWDLVYSSNARRKYVINNKGIVTWGKKRSKLKRDNDLFLLDFGDGKLESLSFKNNELTVNHYNPKENYPNIIYTTAISSRK